MSDKKKFERPMAMPEGMPGRPGPGGPGSPGAPGAPGKKRERPMAEMQGRRGPGGGGHRGPMMIEKPKNAGVTIKRLTGYFKSKIPLLIIVLCTCLLTALINIMITRINGIIIDDYVMVGDIRGLLFICLALLSMYIINAGCQLLQQRTMIRISQSTTAKMRKDLFDSLDDIPLKYFDTHPTGDLMSRLTNDIDTVSFTISQSITQIFSGVVSLVGTLIAMLMISPIMTLVGMVMTPVLTFMVRSITKVSRKYFSQQQKDLGILNGYVEEMISGQKVVKLFSREDKVTEEFEELNEKLRISGTKAQAIGSIMGPLSNMTNNISYLIVAAFGGYLAVTGSMTIGKIFSFLQYMRSFGQPINQIANMLNSLQSALAAAERVFTVIDEPKEQDDPGAVDCGTLKGDIELRDVTFSYIPGKPVLKHADISAKPGQQIAIVGPTGAGKTTIISLLTRFYEIDSGEILIDGRNIKELTRNSLRRSVGMVLQDTYLFSVSVMENIRYGKPDATDEEVIAAAKTANAHSFITHLPQGYDTVLNDNASNLSQGQRQLLAIARAVLMDPELLILDEATSSIDTRTELRIQEAMLELMKGRTSFIIAHRLSTIRNADKILVINNGEVVESGTHTELLAKPDGFYNHLYTSQFSTGLSL